MRHRKPIYRTRKETVLAQDAIKPYGDRMEVSSESAREALALKLMGCEPDGLEHIDRMLSGQDRHPLRPDAIKTC